MSDNKDELISNLEAQIRREQIYNAENWDHHLALQEQVVRLTGTVQELANLVLEASRRIVAIERVIIYDVGEIADRLDVAEGKLNINRH